MIAFVYQTLAKLGYSHPLHAILVHLPVGMVMGAFLFVLASRLLRSADLARTAWRCLVLALIVLLPTALLGIMDWLHFYGGGSLFPIRMKLVLAGLLAVFLVLAVVGGLAGRASSRRFFALCLCCLLTVGGLGYFGGELVYGTGAADAERLRGQADEGAALFRRLCFACHFADRTTTKIGPGLKGLFQRHTLPASGQPVSEENFRRQLVRPFDKMPPFGYLTEEQAAALAAYLKTRGTLPGGRAR